MSFLPERLIRKTPAGGIGAAIAAATTRRKRSLLRHHEGGHAPVTTLELFFDLVYVFAVTKLTHFLLDNMTFLGALQTAILFAAMWWAWMFTTWVTNWIDPDRGINRLMIGTIMLLSMLMAVAIPGAFADSALTFALTYVAIQVGRSLYTTWTMERDSRGDGRSMMRISVWFIATAPLWIGGALVSSLPLQLTLWATALVIEYAGPSLFYPVPGLGRSSATDWVISGGHMSERCGLFIIIALGEGLIITGATYAGAKGQPGIDLALVNAFIGSFAMWWLYFDIGARRGARHIEHHDLPGLVARQAFTYWHIPIVAGIITLAVGDEIMLAHPLEPSHADYVAVVVAGAALFIGGLAGFKRISSGNPWYPASHGYGLGLLVLIAIWGFAAHPAHLALVAAVTALICVVAVWEWVSFHGGWMERMERRDMWLGRVLRRRFDRRAARREAQAARKG